MSILGKAFRVAVLFGGLLMAGSLYAQATRTWISGVGDDANPCSRTAPCKTFAGAISKTAAGGVIDVLDPGGFGGVTITKSITLENDGAIGSVLVSGTNGIIVNGAGAVVVLRGLSIEGIGTGLAGVKFLNGRQLTVERCDIGDFNDGTSGTGIAFTPSAAANLVVIDSSIHNNGSATNPASTGGILIAPSGGVTANAMLENVRLVNNNGFGLLAQGSATVTLRDSVVSMNSGSGAVASSTTLATNMMLDRSTIGGNGASGVVAQGAAAFVQLSDTTITRNAQGIQATGGAAIVSFGNNRNFNNTINGAPTITTPLQ
ncbi:MAG: right-handed parallel beta-helix repeat-containing protein [Proteobacteria bacterium]|nr:right-handed parallel beta-helix repeat-containing protein [Pseudomonadota bacterium]